MNGLRAYIRVIYLFIRNYSFPTNFFKRSDEWCSQSRIPSLISVALASLRALTERTASVNSSEQGISTNISVLKHVGLLCVKKSRKGKWPILCSYGALTLIPNYGIGKHYGYLICHFESRVEKTCPVVTAVVCVKANTAYSTWLCHIEKPMKW